MTHRVASTLTTDVKFEEYSKPVEGGLPQVVRKVFIRGGANRADKHAETPAAVFTDVNDEDFSFLMQHSTFQRFLKSGHVTFARSHEHPEVVAAQMASGDKSAQTVPEDYTDPDKKGEVNQPSSGEPRKAK